MIINLLLISIDKWPLRCQKSITQSPVDVVTAKLRETDYDSLQQKNWNKDYNGTASNNGYTIIITLNNDDPISITGGGLTGTYNLDQLHFHWGAEHTIDGKRAALEAHWLTFNNKFTSVDEAKDYKNGIATLAVLYDLDAEDNELLAPITDELGSLQQVTKSASITINPNQLLPSDITEFYRYWGSRTTPDCDEGVIWTIFTEKCTISQNQVNKFKSIQNSEGEPLSKNYRDTQPLNERNLYLVTTN